MSGALLGALALFSGFFAEMLVVVATTVCYLWWRVSATLCNTSIGSHNSSLEGATKLKFVPFCSS